MKKFREELYIKTNLQSSGYAIWNTDINAIFFCENEFLTMQDCIFYLDF